MAENQEFKLASGATLQVTVSEFKYAKKFQNEIFNAIRGLSNLKETEMMALAMTVASSEPVEQAFFKCAERALYKPDGTDQTAQKVAPALFDDPKYGDAARREYQEIFSKVAEVNVKPFMQALFSVYEPILPDKSSIARPK